MFRYIILELLAGGDLKTFLRESRPKPVTKKKFPYLKALNILYFTIMHRKKMTLAVWKKLPF